MKQTLQRLLCIVLGVAAAVCCPVSAFAQGQAVKPVSTAQYQKYIMQTYGVTDVYIAPEAATLAYSALANFDAACQLIGTEAAQKIIKRWVEVKHQFKLSITLPQGAFYAMMGDNGELTMQVDVSGLVLPRGFVCPVKSAVHEMMHAADYGVLGECKAISTAKGTGLMAAVNGPYNGFTNLDQYVSEHAAFSPNEDFADTAAIMIVSGGNAPCRLSPSSILYRKYAAVYSMLRREFGDDAVMVRRSAAFLGQTLPVGA